MPSLVAPPSPAEELVQLADQLRLEAVGVLPRASRAALGQYFTPQRTTRYMASMFQHEAGSDVRLLDCGAGVGTLTAAYVAAACVAQQRPASLRLTAYELDPILVPLLERTLREAARVGQEHGIAVQWEIHNRDFVRDSVSKLGGGLFGDTSSAYDHAILNPPYKKIRTDSEERALLREVGAEVSNLYAGFLWLTLAQLRAGGQMVSITPRSFCNGPYFKPLRTYLLGAGALERLHVYESRDQAFSDDEVLQETVIMKMTAGVRPRDVVDVRASDPGEESEAEPHLVAFSDVVLPSDADLVIHLPSGDGGYVSERVRSLRGTLGTLGLTVSTGRVVDFRVKQALRATPASDTIPLIYPTHFAGGVVQWPKADSRKPNALALDESTEKLAVPSGWYVLVKRFSAKEETRRVSAAVLDPSLLPAGPLGFENHLNYFHRAGAPLDRDTALGLCAYLNSSLLDEYFRVFNGHTQVNASDLRSLPYPTAEQLAQLGRAFSDGLPDQQSLDERLETLLLNLSENDDMPSASASRIEEAVQILRELGLPREQQNERSGLTLLALLHLGPDDDWEDATRPLMGVTPIMAFAQKWYKKVYAPNTRETFRRFTLHQFVEAGLAILNPDKLDRPTNSPKSCYQITTEAHELIKTFGKRGWASRRDAFLAQRETLAQRYAAEREMARIPVRLPDGGVLTLSAGGQNVLVKQIVEVFLPQYTPGGTLVYVGDTEAKDLLYDKAYLARLGVTLGGAGKMPDVIVHFTEKNWLVLIEAVTSHGPVNGKRLAELKCLFGGSSAGLVFVSTFLTRSDFIHYAKEIAWETDVWIADNPTHMVHFNGERFLGPY